MKSTINLLLIFVFILEYTSELFIWANSPLPKFSLDMLPPFLRSYYDPKRQVKKDSVQYFSPHVNPPKRQVKKAVQRPGPHNNSSPQHSIAPTKQPNKKVKSAYKSKQRQPKRIPKAKGYYTKNTKSYRYQTLKAQPKYSNKPKLKVKQFKNMPKPKGSSLKLTQPKHKPKAKLLVAKLPKNSPINLINPNFQRSLKHSPSVYSKERSNGGIISSLPGIRSIFKGLGLKRIGIL